MKQVREEKNLCGIAGFWNKKKSVNLEETIRQMTQTIEHRGPDDEGFWIDDQTGLALGHRRLSIIDLSPNGHQPMLSHSERYVIVYNGEIYNFRELTKQVKEHPEGQSIRFRGSSDTEVILACIECFGLKEAIKRFVGMFAIAVYDRKNRTLHLVRDRMGEKPLYYGFVNDNFVFGSELKALRTFPGFSNPLDRGALALYFKHNYIPGPYSIYQNINKLRPGTMLTINEETDSLPEPEAYWSVSEVALKGLENTLPDSPETLARLEELLMQSIRGQMVSDVPLGAFLSGGIDSSLVVALMQAQSDIPVKTFTIGFTEKGYNEAEEAKKVAQHLKTDHTELYITPKEAMEVIPLMPQLYDEPFSDSSQIPTFLVSRLTRQRVTVSLSGDGGDELFGGYNRYFQTQKIWSKIDWMPYGMRKHLARFMKAVPVGAWDKLYSVASIAIPPKYRFRLFGDKVHKLSGLIGSYTIQGIYDGCITHWSHADQLVLDTQKPRTILDEDYGSHGIKDNRLLMMYLDSITYLPDDILVKVDRAAMGVSLETRVPLLDHRVVEYSWQLPLSMKFRDGKGKWALREILYKYVPKELIERPKMGFGVPIGDWMRGPLRDWAEELLSEKRLNEEGFLKTGDIRQKWEEHLSGRYNWQYHIWDVLMFEAWLDKQKELL